METDESGRFFPVSRTDDPAENLAQVEAPVAHLFFGLSHVVLVASSWPDESIQSKFIEPLIHLVSLTRPLFQQASRKRPVASGRSEKPPAKKRTLKPVEDEEIPSDIESDLEDSSRHEVDLDAEIELNEDPKEKKLRLAKKFLAEIQELEKERSERQEFDAQAALEDEGEEEEAGDTGTSKVNRFFRVVASSYVQPEESTFKYLRNGHRLPVTCVVISPDSSFVISGGKDGRLIKWDVKTQRKVKVIHEKKKGDKSDKVGHTSTVTSIAISHDGKFVASGETSAGAIKIWNGESLELLEQLEGHRSGISGLVFRRGSYNLYSCSSDRSVKSWNIDEMSYIETLYGHQEPITAIDSLYRERAITAGGRDSSLRVWKIPEDSQLVFQASPGSCVDAVKFLDNQHFVSGADDG